MVKDANARVDKAVSADIFATLMRLNGIQILQFGGILAYIMLAHSTHGCKLGRLA